MNRGYVKLWRKSLDDGWLKQHELWIFWSYCLLKASHKAYVAIVGSQRVDLLPGQFIFGRKRASDETGLTEREIRTCLALLTKWENVTSKTTNKFTVITIVNWHSYQSHEASNDQQNDQYSTSSRPHTRIKEHKKNIYSQNSLQVLAYLNEKTGKKFRDASHIEARLKDGGTIADCLQVIDNKLRDPFFIETPKHLNPVTLFRKSHWDKYLNEFAEVKQSSW